MLEIKFLGRQVVITSSRCILPCEYSSISDMAHNVFEDVVIKVVNLHTLSLYFSTMAQGLKFYDDLDAVYQNIFT